MMSSLAVSTCMEMGMVQVMLHSLEDLVQYISTWNKQEVSNRKPD